MSHILLLFVCCALLVCIVIFFFFFFQAEDGIRDRTVTGVQTCALPIYPSQSFDTSRVELLLKELATAATHAQLIVASHEDDRFEPFIDTYFTAGSYRVLHVVDFTPEAGPILEWAC